MGKGKDVSKVAAPTPAKHAIVAVLKAGEAVYDQLHLGAKSSVSYSPSDSEVRSRYFRNLLASRADSLKHFFFAFHESVTG